MEIFFGIVLSYLLGSIPTAYIAGRIYKGIDIRKHGSGNMGATNVFRVLGKWPGIIVLIVDIFKGTLAVVWVGDIFHLESVWSRVFLAVAAVGGHNWTIFLQFRGGKGVATSLGVLVGLTIKFSVLRPVLFITFLIWAVAFLTTAFISLASIVAAVALPIIMIATYQRLEIVSLGVIFCIFVIIRHKANIKRLLNGEEPRVKLPFYNKK